MATAKTTSWATWMVGLVVSQVAWMAEHTTSLAARMARRGDSLEG